jgi:hypothetical protein
MQHTAHHHSLYGKSHYLLNHIRHHFGDGYIEKECNFAQKQIICQPPIQPGEKKRQESHTNWCAYPINSPAQPPFFFYIQIQKHPTHFSHPRYKGHIEKKGSHITRDPVK